MLQIRSCQITSVILIMIIDVFITDSQNQHFKLHSTNRNDDRVNVQNNTRKTGSLTVLYSFIQLFFMQQQKVSSDYQVNEIKPNEMHIGDEYFAVVFFIRLEMGFVLL